MFFLSYSISGCIVLTALLLQWWQQSTYPLWLWIGISACAIAGFVVLMRSTHKGLLVLFCTAAIALTVMRVADTHPSSALETLFTQIGTTKSVIFYGEVVQDPDIRKDRINYTLNLDGIQTASGETLSATGRILVTDTSRWPIYQRGSIVRAQGSVLRAEDGYGDYLSVHGIRYTARTYSITKIGYEKPFILWRILFSARRQFSLAIQRAFPEPSASLLDGLLTGSRAGLSDELNDVFKRTGLTHIIAVSGSNITIVLSVIGGLLFFLPFQWRLLPSVGAVILFTFFVGAEASVVRACIMGILGLIALHSGNTKTMRLTILWTAAFMVLWNPRSLWYDAGFQLSFLAVIGLTEFQPLLTHVLKHVPLPQSIREALLTTIAAQITAMPWVVYKFGTLSIVSPLANVLVAPFIPIAMFVGFIGVTLHAISPMIGMIISGLGHIVLSVIIRIALVSNAIPYAAISLDTVASSLLWAYYCSVVFVVWWIIKRSTILHE